MRLFSLKMDQAALLACVNSAGLGDARERLCVAVASLTVGTKHSVWQTVSQRLLLFPTVVRRRIVPSGVSVAEYVARNILNVMSEFAEYLRSTRVCDVASVVRGRVRDIKQKDSLCLVTFDVVMNIEPDLYGRLVVCAGRLGLVKWSNVDERMLCAVFGVSFDGMECLPFACDVECDVRFYDYVGPFFADMSVLLRLYVGASTDRFPLLQSLADIRKRVGVDLPLNPVPVGIPCTPRQRAVVSNLSHSVECVQGPPGTGKTVSLIHIVLMRRPADSVVLITAVQNRAVESVVERLERVSGVPFLVWGHADRVGVRCAQHVLDNKAALCPGVRACEFRLIRCQYLMHVWPSWLHNLHWRRVAVMMLLAYESQRLSRLRKHALDAQRRRLMADCTVVLCTIDSVGALLCNGDCGDLVKRLSVVCVDEAGTVPEHKVAMLASISTLSMLVLVGDHMQLPPFSVGTNNKVSSVLDRFSSARVEMHMLRTQFRMHPQLGALVSDLFYQGRVTTDVETSLARTRLCGKVGVYWANAVNSAESKEEGTSNSTSNVFEAKYIADALRSLDPTMARRVMVITFYQAQVNLLRRLLRDVDVSIATVDSAQGTEADVVVLSGVRANDDMELGFVGDGRRINVAISRARLRLVVVGHAPTFARHPIWKAVRARSKIVGKLDAAVLCVAADQ
jgi:hypothetical protein